jgi:acetyl esterase
MQLDPDAQLLLDAMIRARRPQFETLTPVAARQQMRDIRAALKQPQPPVAEVRELTAQGSHGEIPLRLYRSRARSPGEAQPVLVFFHGGGWVFGDLETHDNLCRSLANVAGAPWSQWITGWHRNRNFRRRSMTRLRRPSGSRTMHKR